MGARTELLDRVRKALGAAEAAPIARRYRGSEGETGEAVVDRFSERAADYGASVWQLVPEDLEGVIAERCAALGVRRLVLPPEAPWRPVGVEAVVDDPPLRPVDLDELDGTLTGCTLAIAETGTLVLDGSGNCGRRALTLVPDLHLCVVRSEDIVAALPDAVSALATAAREGQPLTFISGPSATSDIGLQRVEGVHGPRKIELFILVGSR